MLEILNIKIDKPSALCTNKIPRNVVVTESFELQQHLNYKPSLNE